MDPYNLERAGKYFKNKSYAVYYKNILNLFCEVIGELKNNSVKKHLDEYFDLFSNRCCPRMQFENPYFAQGAADKIIDKCNVLITIMDWDTVDEMLAHKAVEGVLTFAKCSAYYFEGKISKDKGYIDTCARLALDTVIAFSWIIGWDCMNEELTHE